MIGKSLSVFMALAFSFANLAVCTSANASPNKAGADGSTLASWRNEQLTPEQVTERATSDALLSEYVAKRDAAKETVTDQMKLANWCRQQGLLEESRAHLTMVLELDSNHAEGRSQLGFRKVGDQWLEREEMSRSKQRARAALQATYKYLQVLKGVVAGLQSNSPQMQTAAKDRLLAIKDADAIAVMEASLGQGNETAELALVEALAAMTSPEATVALARVALDTRSNDVRDEATKQLKTKRFEDFVPSLMASLVTPITSQVALYQSPDGRLTYRHRFYCEGEEVKRLTILDQQFRNRLGGEVTDAATIARQQAEVAVSATRASIKIEDNNEGICKLLNRITELDLPAKPEVWWSWWNDVTETALAEEKPLYQNYVSQEQVLNDAPTYFAELSDGYRQLRRCECLVAGTPVWTQTGLQPIESIHAGDLVLSKDTETGELAYKAVLRPTERAPVPLISIRLPDETIVASGGHLFWTVENGWQRARQLQAGTMLQLLNGTVEILSTEEVKPEKTYNLIVADFHTYFVGPHKLLSHDNTSRTNNRPTQIQVDDKLTRNE